MDMRDNELSPLSFGEVLVADDTIRNLSNESNDNSRNTVVIDEGDVVTVESSVNNTVDGNNNNSGKNSNKSNKNSNVGICSNTELSNELSQSQGSSSSDLSWSVLLRDAEMIEASGAWKQGILSVDVSSDGAPTRVPASRKGAKKRVSASASSQEPWRAVHAYLPSAASSIPLRKCS